MNQFETDTVNAPAPLEWRQTSVVRFLNDPYADEALAEPVKTFIDLGEVAADACYSDIQDVVSVKKPGRTELEPYPGSPEVMRAHRLFMDGVRQVAGDDNFTRASITFEYRRRYDFRSFFALKPHLDGGYRADPDFNQTGILRIVGIVCTYPPTIILQGAVRPDQLTERGELVERRFRNPLKRLTPQPLPEGRVIMLSPSTLHTRDDIPREIRNRLFMRWHVRY